MPVDEVPQSDRQDASVGLDGWRLVEGFARYVVSSWGVTLRFVVVLSIPTVSALLVVVALVEVDHDPLWLLGALPSAVLVVALARFLRTLRRHRAKTGPDRW